MIEKNILQVSIGLNHKHPQVQEVTQKMLDINKSHTYILIDSEQKMDDWVIENYNAGENCNHKKVSETGFIVIAGESSENVLIKGWDGFCDICNEIVYATTTLKNKPLQRWKR